MFRRLRLLPLGMARIQIGEIGLPALLPALSSSVPLVANAHCIIMKSW